MIKENKLITDDLNFKPVSSDLVSKQINKLNIKKATGYDGISPKILKLSMPCIVEPITFFLLISVLMYQFFKIISRQHRLDRSSRRITS
jgi:hypothetical protein